MLYKNKKTGNIYRHLAFGINATNKVDGQKVVIYCPDNNEHTIFVREEKEFFETFDIVYEEE